MLCFGGLEEPSEDQRKVVLVKEFFNEKCFLITPLVLISKKSFEAISLKQK